MTGQGSNLYSPAETIAHLHAYLHRLADVGHDCCSPEDLSRQAEANIQSAYERLLDCVAQLGVDVCRFLASFRHDNQLRLSMRAYRLVDPYLLGAVSIDFLEDETDCHVRYRDELQQALLRAYAQSKTVASVFHTAYELIQRWKRTFRVISDRLHERDAGRAYVEYLRSRHITLF